MKKNTKIRLDIRLNSPTPINADAATRSSQVAYILAFRLLFIAHQLLLLLCTSRQSRRIRLSRDSSLLRQTTVDC